MKEGNVIEVKDIYKKFRIYLDKGKTLKEKVIFKNSSKYEDHWVLNGISFDIKKGDAIGLIGHNGCGKSTTLKLLTGIMYPESGTIEKKGRVSSLLELGAGFHPDLSGRENIYINASTFGLTKKEIDKRMEEIIEFSELEEYIDNPVRTYSSGMYMRLAFSVAISVDADILLIDEVLAVGDVNFQSKCFEKLMELKRRGTTFVLVSHSTAQIEQVCERCIWLEEGKIRCEGATAEVTREYMKYMGEQRRIMEEKHQKKQRAREEELKELETEVKDNENRYGSGEARVMDVSIYDQNGEPTFVFDKGDDVTIEVQYKVLNPLEHVRFEVNLCRSDCVLCSSVNSLTNTDQEVELTMDGKFRIIFRKIPLLNSEYYIDVIIKKAFDEIVDFCGGKAQFTVISSCKDGGITEIEHDWETQ